MRLELRQEEPLAPNNGPGGWISVATIPRQDFRPSSNFSFQVLRVVPRSWMSHPINRRKRRNDELQFDNSFLYRWSDVGRQFPFAHPGNLFALSVTLLQEGEDSSCKRDPKSPSLPPL